jgi:hypothetical protein
MEAGPDVCYIECLAWERAMSDLRDEISTYDAMRADLEAKFLGRWALIHDLGLIGTYGSFDDAAKEAVHQFGRGPYLIRRVGAAPISVPASLTYHADDQLRI